MNEKKWGILEKVSGLCVILLLKTMIRKILGEIDKHKAAKDVIGTSEFKEEKYEKNA